VDGARKVTPHGGAALALPVYWLPVAPHWLYTLTWPGELTESDT
jgi:hypothetical protein